MKSFILIAVLAALTVCNDAASIAEDIALTPEQAALFAEEGIVYREDIKMYQKGEIRSGDVMFYSYTCNLPGIPHTVQYEDVRYSGNSTTRITTVYMSNLPPVPGRTWLGLLGTTHFNVRVMSAPGAGLFSSFEYWGHYTDWV